MEQSDLFSVKNLAAFVDIPRAPVLVPHSEWPYPGMTPEDSARSALANSSEHADMLAQVVHSQGGAKLTAGQVLSLVPADWRDLLGPFAHAHLTQREGEQRSIQVGYVPHEGGGCHFTYQAVA